MEEEVKICILKPQLSILFTFNARQPMKLSWKTGAPRDFVIWRVGGNLIIMLVGLKIHSFQILGRKREVWIKKVPKIMKENNSPSPGSVLSPIVLQVICLWKMCMCNILLLVSNRHLDILSWLLSILKHACFCFQEFWKDTILLTNSDGFDVTYSAVLAKLSSIYFSMK